MCFAIITHNIYHISYSIFSADVIKQIELSDGNDGNAQADAGCACQLLW